MDNEIRSHALYTPVEAQQILKISRSTFKRLIKKGLIRANKIGGQYRILGKELLRLVSPVIEKKAVETYLATKTKVVRKINKW